MQNLPHFQLPRVSSFVNFVDQTATLTARTIALAGLLLSTFSSHAQITPSSGGAPAPSGTIQLPPGVRIPAGTPLPPGVQVSPSQGNGRSTQPGRTGQQGANTTPGRTGTTPTNGQATQGNTNGRQQVGNNGQTGQNGQATQNGQRGQNGQATAGTVNADGTVNQGDVPLNASEEGEDNKASDNGQTDAEAVKAIERATTRRKLYGYEIFNSSLATTFQPNINIATPVNYVLGTSDQLNISMYGVQDESFSQTVTPEGNIYLPKGVGPVHVAGLTVEAARNRISERLAKIYVGLKNSSYGPKNTYLEITLGNIRTIRVSVLGEVIKPGTYSISSLSPAMNAIYAAGGPSELGSFRAIQVIRNNRIIATIDLYDLLLTGVLRNNIRLQDNDNIRIPGYISHVELTGTTRRNNIFELMPDETLERLLYYGGGFAANAYKNRIKVTRLTNREIKVIDVLADQYRSFTMQDGDLAGVEQVLDRYENQVTIAGAVYRPGVFSLDQNKTLKELVTSAEGPKGDALMGRVNISRTREDLTMENITIDLTKVLAGTDPDVVLQREDLVTVNSKFDLAEYGAISIQGEVNRPGPVSYISNLTLEDAFVRVGGLKESAATGMIEIVRRKKDVDPSALNAQTAEVFRFSVDRNLDLSNDTKFFLFPYDQVIVRRSPSYQVQTFAEVEGEVIIPGQYPIKSKDMKISDLVLGSGGLTPQAYVDGATLIRRVQLSQAEIDNQNRAVSELADDSRKAVVDVEASATDKQEAIGISLRRILARPGSSEDILLQSGDVLRIPKRLETVRIGGEVLLPTTVKYRGGQTFQDYISQAGGFTDKSQRHRSFVVYANGSVDRTRKFMFFNLYPRIEPGALVVVPQSRRTPLTPQQILGQASGIVGSLISLITTVLLLSRIN